MSTNTTINNDIGIKCVPTRNNLYWVDKISSPCIWYELNDEVPYGTAIRIIPICCRDYDPTVCILRGDLKQLEKSHTRRLVDKLHADFVRSMMDFAEWDDYDRLSYVWPHFLINLVTDLTSIGNWIKYIENCRFNVTFPDRRYHILFCLCAEHIGLLEDCLSLTYHDEIPERIDLLLKSVYLFMDTNSMRDFKKLTTRVGIDFQADIPSNDAQDNVMDTPQKSMPIIDEVSPAIDDNNDSEYDWSLIHSPTSVSEAIVDKYLHSVKSLKQVSYLQIQVIPINSKTTTSTISFSLNTSTTSTTSTDASVSNEITGPYTFTPCAVTVIPKPSKAGASTDTLLPLQSSSFNPNKGNLWMNHDSSSGEDSPSPRPKPTSRLSPNQLPSKIKEETDPPVDCHHYQGLLSDGQQSWSIPLENCVYEYVHDDIALEIFRRCIYQESAALEEVASVLQSQYTHQQLWCPSLIEAFRIEAQRCREDSPMQGGLDLLRVFKSLQHEVFATDNNINSSISHNNSNSSSNNSNGIGNGNDVDMTVASIENQNEASMLSTPPNSFTMKRMVEYYVHYYHRAELMTETANTLYHATQQSLPPPTKPRLSQLYSRALKAKSEWNGVQSHRWPPSLPMIWHNLYWIKNANGPCICLGLDPLSLRTPGEGSLLVLPISCMMYRHATSVNGSALEPLSDEHSRMCTDDRSSDFALAMMDFAYWEQHTYEGSSSTAPVPSNDTSSASSSSSATTTSTSTRSGGIAKWYSYPPFIIAMLSKPSQWASWRKSAEREARGHNLPRRAIYFNKLQASFLESPLDPARDLSGLLPWDDSPLPKEEAAKKESSTPTTSGSAKSVTMKSGGTSNSTNLAIGKGKASPLPSELQQQQRSVQELSLGEVHTKSKEMASHASADNKAKRETTPTATATAAAATVYSSDKKSSKRTREARDIFFPEKMSVARTGAVGGGVGVAKESQAELDEVSTHSPVLSQPPQWNPNRNKIYWLSRNTLPALLMSKYEEGRGWGTKVRLQPVCCASYHYPVEVPIARIEEFTANKLKLCHDDKTQDFVFALLDFSEYLIKLYIDDFNTNNSGSKSSPTDSNSSRSGSSSSPPIEATFCWPSCVQTLLDHPQDFSLWRKKVERAARGRRDLRKDGYFQELVDLFHSTDEGISFKRLNTTTTTTHTSTSTPSTSSSATAITINITDAQTTGIPNNHTPSTASELSEDLPNEAIRSELPSDDPKVQVADTIIQPVPAPVPSPSTTLHRSHSRGHSSPHPSPVTDDLRPIKRSRYMITPPRASPSTSPKSSSVRCRNIMSAPDSDPPSHSHSKSASASAIVPFNAAQDLASPCKPMETGSAGTPTNSNLKSVKLKSSHDHECTSSDSKQLEANNMTTSTLPSPTHPLPTSDATYYYVSFLLPGVMQPISPVSSSPTHPITPVSSLPPHPITPVSSSPTHPITPVSSSPTHPITPVSSTSIIFSKDSGNSHISALPIVTEPIDCPPVCVSSSSASGLVPSPESYNAEESPQSTRGAGMQTVEEEGDAAEDS